LADVTATNTPFDELVSVKTVLTSALKQAANELHNTSSRSSLSGTSTHDEPFLEPAARQHRCLAEQYKQILKQVRKISGFETFLQPKRAVARFAAL
jgi:hypothetical protein